MAKHTMGSKASLTASMLTFANWLNQPSMRWQRQIESGEARVALKVAQQLAGGPARGVPVERKGVQLKRLYKVDAQLTGGPVAGAAGGDGGGLVAAGCRTPSRATATASKETAEGAIAADADAGSCGTVKV